MSRPRDWVEDSDNSLSKRALTNHWKNTGRRPGGAGRVLAPTSRDRRLRPRSALAVVLGLRFAKRVKCQMAIMLVQECQKALVIGHRQLEELDQLAVVALRVLQPALDDLPHVVLGQLAVHESLPH